MPIAAKDRLIAALAAQLRAEQETREALAFVIRSGQLDRAALTAILDDPIPGFTAEDLAWADQMVAESHSGASQLRRAS
ncbi:hypothetical protein [Bosea beijingensis]|uniref:hypothetical protein n=1 Tax=Bosea beijingensis TaxID=3068632 RepID=UPI0027409847|nr:hypothetical protein [Bosea sp. REN20]